MFSPTFLGSLAGSENENDKDRSIREKPIDSHLIEVLHDMGAFIRK